MLLKHCSLLLSHWNSIIVIRLCLTQRMPSYSQLLKSRDTDFPFSRNFTLTLFPQQRHRDPSPQELRYTQISATTIALSSCGGVDNQITRATIFSIASWSPSLHESQQPGGTTLYSAFISRARWPELAEGILSVIHFLPIYFGGLSTVVWQGCCLLRLSLPMSTFKPWSEPLGGATSRLFLLT